MLAYLWAMEHIAHNSRQDVLLGSLGLLPGGGSVGAVALGGLESLDHLLPLIRVSMWL